MYGRYFVVIEREGAVEMKKQDIIGYYDYYSDSYSFSRKGEGKGKLIIDKDPSNVRGFFQNDHICPFCKTSTKTVF